jgi:primosomal protein N' (replication factor Y) (superfamily II helicase)
MEPVTLFADVILPLPLPRLYTYRVPQALSGEVATGKRVIVQFGRQKIYSALISTLHTQAPAGYEAKYLLSVLDEQPVVTESQLEFWKWISSYYMCTLGEVMTAALPSALKLQSETRVLLSPEAEVRHEELSDKEFLIIEALDVQSALTLSEISKILDQKTIFPVVKSLLEKKLVMLEEEIEEKYRPRKVDYVSLTPRAAGEDWMREMFGQLEKSAPRQLDLLMAFYKHTMQDRSLKKLRKDLLLKEGGSAAALNALVKKEVFLITTEAEDRVAVSGDKEDRELRLSEAQEQALEAIRSEFKVKDVVLLHGVTSSGKTEVYIRLIEETVKAGRQVLYLLPEIALATQIIRRLKSHFGGIVGIYHSRFNEQERVEIWNKALSAGSRSDMQIIVGARSSMFLPFSNLGLVIVDEEHETSYKQFDPAPRYNARDAAIYLARSGGAKALLGSATPSIESYYNAEHRKYGLAELSERYGNTELPEIILADTAEEKRKKTMKSHFTSVLLASIGEALAKGEQVILFQNRRGYAPLIQCGTCAWVPQCLHCDVSLTYHKHHDLLRCHYCGYHEKPPSRCVACGDSHIQMLGFGTEKIEDELALFFPEVRIARMDADSTRSKNAYQRIITDFENKETNVLVGTQMITKGLDFSNVSTVGILNADSMLSFPDFRAFERSFQLMIQVSGRSGRRGKRGKVIIQTARPDHPVIAHILAHDYKALFRKELMERNQFGFPPFFRLIEITLRHRDFNVLNHAADVFAAHLKEVFGDRLLGPEYPLIPRVKNYYLKRVLLKIGRDSSVVQAKSIVSGLVLDFKGRKEFSSVFVQVDVDPL